MKYYVVWKGRIPGIYKDWPSCQAQIEGFEGARYKSFPSLGEAEKAYDTGPPQVKPAAKMGPKVAVSRSAIRQDSLSVDAACSGNPGEMEYQGVETSTGRRIFHQGSFPLGTNNVGEFLAIVHALALLQKQGLPDMPIYSDSQTAIGWVKKKKHGSKLVRNAKSEALWKLIDRAVEWLHANTYRNPIIKWETEDWGEIPADFGRKG